MQTNARVATDHMRSFSIAVTTANTLAAQTAGEPSTQSRDEFDAEVDKMIDEMMDAAAKKARQELLDEMNGVRESTGVAATPPPATAGHSAGDRHGGDPIQVPHEEQGPAVSEISDTPVDWGEPNGDEPPSELDLRIRYGEWVP